MPGYKAAADLAESGALDGLFAQIDAGEIDLTGDGQQVLFGSAATNLSEHGISCDITPPEMNSAVASAGTEFIAAFTSSFGLFNIRFNLAEGA